MRLTWRDAVATVITGVVLAGFLVYLAGPDLPLLGSARALAGVVLVLGIVGCAVGTAEAVGPVAGTTTMVAGGLGTVALLAAILTMITGSTLLLTVLVGTVVALWAMATLHHIHIGQSTVDNRPRG